MQAWLKPGVCFLFGLQALRTSAAAPHERKACAHRLAANERVSRAGDIKVLEWLIDACLLQLSSLPTR